MNRLAAFVLAGVLLAFGIVHAQAIKTPEAAAALLARGKIRLTPVDLFPGDLKRLQPHLDIAGVCYKVEYNGPEVLARIVLEEWKNGTREGYSSNGMELKGPLAGEVSISIKPERDDEGHPASRVVDSVQRAGSASTIGRQYFSKPQLKHAISYTRTIKQTSDFGTDVEIPMWAVLHFNKGAGGIGEGKSIEDLAKEAEYAIVWKLVPGGKE